MKITVQTEWHGVRIEKILNTLFPKRTKRIWKQFLNKKNVSLGSNFLKYGDRVFRGSTLIINEPIPPKDDEWEPKISPHIVTLVKEGNTWAVIRKPHGIPTIPLSPQDYPTAAGGVKYLFPKIKGEPAKEAGIVNRLDNGTHGLLLIGKSPEIAFKLRQHFSNHQITKKYFAIVHGLLKERIWLEGNIITTGKEKVKYLRDVTINTKKAISLVVPKYHGNNFSILEIITRFGRRHQVRVQLASEGYPIVGDIMYGSSQPINIKGFLLWAYALEFYDPDVINKKEKIIIVDKKIPDSFYEFLNNVYSLTKQEIFKLLFT